ncbi:MAG: TRAP transporter substrate-binding protein DctP [Nevskia sp.]|nr:TRAP transporter substrate-binding protein DctP [Nevskia sp.]
MIKRLLMGTLALTMAVSSALVASPRAQADAGTVIKFAVLAPPGSKWMESINKMNSDLDKKSGGKLKMKIYAGGTMGDEKDVVRKIKQGQLQSAAFTGTGLGEILPSVRVLELPMLFDSTEQIDAVTSKLEPHFNKEFADKGYELLAWSEVGWVYIFSNKPIKNMAELKGTKMWMWEGDRLAKTMFEEMHISPVPLSLTNVRSSLQSGLIDAVYAPPMAVTALQWNSKVRYMLNMRLSNTIGAFLVDKKSYDALSPDLQQLLKAETQKAAREIVGYSRTQNNQTIAALKSQGLQVTDVGAPEREEFTAAAHRAAKDLEGQLYPASLLGEVGSILNKKLT